MTSIFLFYSEEGIGSRKIVLNMYPLSAFAANFHSENGTYYHGKDE